MKTLPPDLAAHLGGRITTLATCWIITRADGVRLGFTDHDRALSVEGVVCQPQNGLSPSAMNDGPEFATGGDRANALEVTLLDGQLQSRTEADVLAGANAMAVRCQSRGWEILQFVTAELIAPKTYRLSTLLRGQRGTETDMLSGAALGADVVLLAEDRTPLVPISSDQSGLSLNYRIVPEGRALDDPAAVAVSHASTQRAARPLAPVHLKARRAGGGIVLSWIRQTRDSGLSWEQAEVPLGEEFEAYEIDILTDQGAVLHTLTSDSSTVLYSSAEELADFGGTLGEIHFAVAQLSQRTGRGHERKAVRHV